MNNSSVITTSAGQSSAFFITTDDSSFIIKTLKPDEFNYIFQKFLLYYYLHIQDHKKSLICRIYGIYSIKIDNGVPLVVILMRNAQGPLKKVRNFKLRFKLDNKIHV